MNFLKKGLAQVSAAVEKAREATTLGTSGGENTAGSRISSGASSSAPSNGSGGSQNAVPSVQTLPDPAILPEIRFDPRDPNEAHVAFLWSVFMGAPENSEARSDALHSFLYGFAEAYTSWSPRNLGISGDSITAARPPSYQTERQLYASTGTLTGCSTGHPSAVLTAFASAAPKQRRAIEAALDVGATSAAMNGGGNLLKKAAGFELFRALAIATRSEHNRVLLHSHGILYEICLTLTLATRRANALAAFVGAAAQGQPGSVSVNKETTDEVVHRVQLLQQISNLLIDTLLNYLEVGGDDKGQNTKPQNHSASPAVKPLMECGALGALVELVRVQRLMRAHVLGNDNCTSSALTLERKALLALCGLLKYSSAAQNSLRASGGLDILVESSGDTTNDIPVHTSTSNTSDKLKIRTLALRALRCAVRRNPQNARNADASGAFGVRLVALMKATSVNAVTSILEIKPFVDTAYDDATLVRKLREVTLSGGGDRGGDDSYDDRSDLVSNALRESDVVPPGELVSSLFRELSSIVAGDENGSAESSGETEYVTVGDNDTDANADPVVGEGLLPVIVAAALISVDQASCVTRKERGTAEQSVASTCGGESISPVASNEKQVTTQTPVPAAAPEGDSGGVGGFVVATGNLFRESSDADDAFGGLSSISTDTSRVPFGANAKMVSQPNPTTSLLDSDEVREAADRLLRAHVLYFLGSLLEARPRAVIDALRKEDAWRKILDDDGAFGATDSSGDSKIKNVSSASPYSAAFGVSNRSVALWLKGARIAGEVVGHMDKVNGVSTDSGGNAPEVLALLETLKVRATQPSAVALLAPALKRLCEIAPRPTSVALLRLDGPSFLGAAVHTQATCWRLHPAAAVAASDPGMLDDLGNSLRVAAQAEVLLLLSDMLVDPALGASTLSATALHDLLFHLMWAPATRPLAVKSIIALITSHCLPGSTSTNASASKQSWDELVRRYLQTLAQAQAIASASHGAQDFLPLFDILQGLRTALAGPGANGLRTRLASDNSNNSHLAYVLIVSLLNGTYGGDQNQNSKNNAEKVVTASVKTLRSLLSGSEQAADQFGQSVGYETLTHALEAAGTVVTKDLVLCVLELVVDTDVPSDFSQTFDAPTKFLETEKTAIRNPGALPVFLKLLRHAPLATSEWGLHALQTLLESSVQSRAAADQGDALSFLLDWFAIEAKRGMKENSTDENQNIFCDLLSTCVGLCASHSFSARDFRGAFRILRDAGIPTESKRQLLRALRLAAKREGPRAYFDFAGNATRSSLTSDVAVNSAEGPGCMVVKQPLPWFMGRTGYTFAAWMRVESFPREGSVAGGHSDNPKNNSPQQVKKARVALFALRGASGLGVAAELGADGVEVTVFSPSGSETVLLDGNAVNSKTIEEKKWMLVTVSHAQATTPLTSACAKLHIDGVTVTSKKLRFPKVVEPLNSCVIGAFDEFAATAFAAAGAVGRAKRSSSVRTCPDSSIRTTHPFSGQIGAVRFFDDALSGSAIAAVAALGPDYLGGFSPTETNSGVALLTAGMSLAEAREVRETMAPRLQLSLNAAAASGRNCFSTVDRSDSSVLATLKEVKSKVETKIKDGIAGGVAGGVTGGIVGGVTGAIAGLSLQSSEEQSNPVAAELVGAARVCATHGAKDVVHCLGGVHVLFPLLAPPETEVDDGSSSHAQANSLNNQLLIKDTVDLLAGLLDSSRLNQEALHASGGFAMVGRLLKMDGGQRLSPGLLPSIENLVKSVGQYAWAGPGNDPDQAAVRLLLDLELWGGSCVPNDALTAHSTFLKRLAKRDPQALRALLPPPVLIDAACCSDPIDETTLKGKTPLSPQDNRNRRRALLHVAGAVLPGAVPALYLETAAAAAYAVEDASDFFSDTGGSIVVDVLDALVEMLQPEHPAHRQLAVAIAHECGGPAMTLAPMARAHAETRALAIRLLAALLPRSKKTNADGDVGSGAQGGGGPGGGGGHKNFTPQGNSGNLDRLVAAPGAFVHSISSAMSSYGGSSAGEKPGGAVGTGASSGGGGVKSLHAPPGLFAAVASSLLPYPLTHSVRAALFELMLGGQPVPAGKVHLARKKSGNSRFTRVSSAVSASFSGAASAASRMLGASHSRSSSLTDPVGDMASPIRLDGGAGAASSGVPGIVHAAAAGVLLRLLEKCDDPEVLLGALETLLRLVEGAPANAHAILTQQGWQQWLIPTLRTDKAMDSKDSTVQTVGQTVTEKEAAHEEARFLTRRLLRALLAHAMLRVDGGAHQVTTTVDVIAAAADRGRLNGTRTTRAVLGDVFDAMRDEDTSMERDTKIENLWGLLPLVEETVARAAGCATGAVTSVAEENTQDMSTFDEDECQMLDGTWLVLDELANRTVGTGRLTRDDPQAQTTQQSSHPVTGDRRDVADTSPQRAAARLAALQRTAFHLAIVYVHGAPLKACAHAQSSLSALLPALLHPGHSGDTSDSSKSSATRLHLFLTHLVRAESLFADSDSARATLAGSIARAAASTGAALLDTAHTGYNNSLTSLGGGTVAELPVDLRSRISEQKAAEAAAEDAKEARRVWDARRAAAVAAADAAAVAFSREQLDERALCQKTALGLTQLCERERLRRATTVASLAEESQTLDRRYRNLHRDLTGETGPWARNNNGGDALDVDSSKDSSSNSSSKPSYKWKLDKAQDFSGRRLRLKRNYQFVEYLDETKSKEVGINESNVNADVHRVLGDAVKRKNLIGETDENDEDEDDDVDEPANENSKEKENTVKEKDVTDLSPDDKRKVILSVSATLVNIKRAVSGRLDISRAWVHFIADEGDDNSDIDLNAGEISPSKKRFWRWPTSRIDEVHRSRYRLQHIAVELFMSGGGSVFLAFQDTQTAKDVSTKIVDSGRKLKADIILMDRKKKLEAAKRVQLLWKNRNLSTFDYLMSLNTLAGRTLNDLTQYPVFPWVLSDYVSEDIDLQNKNQFRDLSKPIGALDSKRLSEFIERYELLAQDPDAQEPPFHYGSHYSSQGIVLHFLLRLEPFTALARQLQGGRFDHADRLFSSVAKTWEGVLKSTADVKELTPEFFYLPEFLENNDGCSFGATQDGEVVNHVELPPWAKGSSHEFIRLMREALESDIVSTTIHEWVDLVFGVAQVGKEAVRRTNVFHHLTYEGSVDLKSIQDPVRRAAAEAHVMNFGQTPAQLFKKPHPKRNPPPSPAPALRHAPGRMELVTVGVPRLNSSPPSPVVFISVDSVPSAVASIGNFKVACVSGNGQVGAHRFLVDSGTSQYSLECDVSSNSLNSKRPTSVSPFAAGATANETMFATIAGGKVLVSCGHWDHGVRTCLTEDGRELQIATGHRDLVTCLAVAQGGGRGQRRPWAKRNHESDDDSNKSVLIVSGSRDTTCSVWEVLPPPGGWNVKSTKMSFNERGGLGHRPKRTLFGHDDAVTCVAASSELDLVVSGGADGAVLLHALRAGRHLRFVRTGRGMPGSSIGSSTTDKQSIDTHGTPSWVHLLDAKVSTARVLVYSGDALCLTSHGINVPCDSEPLACAILTEKINTLCVTYDERFLVLGSGKGSVAVRTAHDLAPWARLDGVGCAITAVTVTEEDCVLGGLQDGRIAVWAPRK